MLLTEQPTVQEVRRLRPSQSSSFWKAANLVQGKDNDDNENASRVEGKDYDGDGNAKKI